MKEIKMTKRIGFINTKNEQGIKNSNEHLRIESGEHALLVGSTGCGKTTLLKKLIAEKVKMGESLVIIDEKNTLETELKAMFKDSGINLYQLGSQGYGTTDIRTSLHTLTCSSDTQSKKFFNGMISEDYENSSTHKFWGKGAASLGYKIHKFAYTIHKLLVLLKEDKDDEVELKKIYPIEYGKKTTKHEFCISSRPMTFKDLEPVLKDFHLYRIISERGYELINDIEDRLKDKFQGLEISKETAIQIDGLLKELKEVSLELSRQRVHENPGEASGVNGLLMTLKSSLNDSLFENPVLNEPYPTHDLFEVLEGEQSIIILNNLDKEILQILFNVISDHLSMRSHKNDIHPVTMVLEELPRYISTTLDLEEMLAYARQSLCSIISVIQDYSQLKKFNDGEIDSILNNTKVFQMNMKDAPLDKFCYRYENDSKVYRFNPDFMSRSEILSVALEYQRNTGQFEDIEKNSNELVLFDNLLYQAKGLVSLVDVESLKERLVPYTLKNEVVEGYFTDQYQIMNRLINEEDNEVEENILDLLVEDDNQKKDVK
jgi:energy-coupling factor transporter ATP-binding protein EcfA2